MVLIDIAFRNVNTASRMRIDTWMAVPALADSTQSRFLRRSITSNAHPLPFVKNLDIC